MIVVTDASPICCLPALAEMASWVPVGRPFRPGHPLGRGFQPAPSAGPPAPRQVKSAHKAAAG